LDWSMSDAKSWDPILPVTKKVAVKRKPTVKKKAIVKKKVVAS